METGFTHYPDRQEREVTVTDLAKNNIYENSLLKEPHHWPWYWFLQLTSLQSQFKNVRKE